ncbi:RDD family protein [Spiroplasma ixodetis]
MNIKKLDTTETYIITKTWKRIIARIFDVIFVSLIPLIIGLAIHYLDNKGNQESWQLIIIFIINIIIVIIYFVIIPWKCKGQTLGKLIFQIRLVNEKNQDLKLKHFFYRELFLVFIPLLLTTSIILFMKLTFNENIATINSNSTLNSWLNILIRSVVSFDFAWYCGIMIVTKIDKYHQLFFDRNHKTFVINKKPLATNKRKISTNVNDPHIHLVYSRPGNINDDELENINSL